MKFKIFVVSIAVFLFSQSVILAQAPCPDNTTLLVDCNGTTPCSAGYIGTVPANSQFFVFVDGITTNTIVRWYYPNGTHSGNTYTYSSTSSGYTTVYNPVIVTSVLFLSDYQPIYNICLIDTAIPPTATATPEPTATATNTATPTATATTEPTATATTEPTATATTEPTATPTTEPTATPTRPPSEPQTISGIITETIGIISIIGGISQLLTLMVLVFMAYYLIKRFLK